MDARKRFIFSAARVESAVLPGVQVGVAAVSSHADIPREGRRPIAIGSLVGRHRLGADGPTACRKREARGDRGSRHLRADVKRDRAAGHARSVHETLEEEGDGWTQGRARAWRRDSPIIRSFH
jgi:hypothetical protein